MINRTKKVLFVCFHRRRANVDIETAVILKYFIRMRTADTIDFV